MISFLYNSFIYEPLLNTLAFLYHYLSFQNLGLAIILLTLLVRLVLFPIFHKGAKHQKKMQKLQPLIKKIQETHKSDKAKQSEAIMALYKEHGINPFSQFGIILLQLPIFIALNSIFKAGFSEESLQYLYSFVPHPQNVSHLFLGIDLTAPSVLIIILAGVAQFFQARLIMPPAPSAKDDQSYQTAKMMSYLSPVLIVVVFLKFPAALALYLLVTTIFSLIQQILVNKHL